MAVYIVSGFAISGSRVKSGAITVTASNRLNAVQIVHKEFGKEMPIRAGWTDHTLAVKQISRWQLFRLFLRA